MNTLWLPLLLISVVRAEEQYFPQLTNATWDEARLHCRSCFRELTAVTSRNVHLIVQNLSCDHWVGLRRRYNDSFPWAAWSNGDPVTYQNWYPGHPVPNKEKKLIPICPSTTESSPSSAITTTTATPMTSLDTSTVTSAPVTFPKSSTMWTNTQEQGQEQDTCPILDEMLDCLNMTCPELEIIVAMCNTTATVTPKTTKNNKTTNVTTFSTTFNATTTEGATTKHSTTKHATTGNTTTERATTERATTERATTERTTTSNCIFEPEPDPDQYIEDACVVLRSFGMWREEDCNTSLPYICYEERFFGQIDVFDKNTSSANVSWSEGPGAENISHYRVEITGDKNQTFNQTDLFEHIQNLTAGTLYSVQVFPVKCGRYLNPQNISFYTQPSDVQNLTIEGMTTDSAYLKWRKPEGNRDFYLVTFINDSKPAEQKCYSENCTIINLIPGTEYEFTVKAVVNKTFEGVASNASNYTIPSTVRNLKSADNDSTIITVSWEKPVGGHSEYYYCLQQVNNSLACPNCSDITNCERTPYESLTETNKPDGSKFCLCVAALTKNNVSGEMVQTSAYTLPKSVNLSLFPGSQYILANWTIDGNFEKFEVTITTSAYPLTTVLGTLDFYYNLTGLKAGVYYNVSVVTLNGQLKSKAATEAIYTEPSKPRSVKATANRTAIDVSWEAPAESQDAEINYKVDCYTAFWNKSYTALTLSRGFRFTDLNPGTRYDINVSVMAGNSPSEPNSISKYTEPDKRTLVLTMLCSSETPFQCDKPDTQKELVEKLKIKLHERFQDLVHFELNARNNSL